MRRRWPVVLIVLCLQSASPDGAADDDVVRVRAPRVALTHVRVIDGTGSPAVEDRTLVIEGGRIVALGPTSGTPVPAGAQTLDLTGHTVIPGLVGMHNHLFYAVPPGRAYVPADQTFPRLYLASGVTTIRTAGTIDLKRDLAVKRAIDRGSEPGPTIHVTSPYFGDAASPRGRDRIVAAVDTLASSGVTSFKAYTSLTRDELAALIDSAHGKGLKVTGHLCAVGYRDAARLGIDNLEHGFFADTEFYSGKVPDRCPENWASERELVDMDVNDERIRGTIAELVTRRVAITSTLAIFESFAGRSEAVDVRMRVVLAPGIRAKWEQTSGSVADTRSRRVMWELLLKKGMELERAFVRAGGRLMAGADPTGWGCCLAGFVDQRNVELLVEAGFTAEQAIQIYTANGAAFLGESDRIGTLAVGKQADLVVIRGNPAARIEDIRNVDLVFKNGVGFDSPKLIESLRGKVGEAPKPNLMTRVTNAVASNDPATRIALFAGGALVLVILVTTLQSWMVRSRRARRRPPEPDAAPPTDTIEPS